MPTHELEAILPPLQRSDETGDAPLSLAQERLWYLGQMQPEDCGHIFVMAIRLTGPLDAESIAHSLDEIVRRHAVLRTAFPVVQGRPVQRIAAAESVAMPVVDLRDVSDDAVDGRVHQVVQEEVRKPFDLAAGNVLRVTMLWVRETERRLLVAVHRIVFDDASIDIFVRELAALYGAFVTGQPVPLVDPPLQVTDVARWQRQWLQSSHCLELELGYWRGRLAGAPALLALPTDRLRPRIRTTSIARQAFALSRTLAEALDALARQEGTPLFVVLLAAFQTLLHRYSNQDDILVGSPISTRTHAETEGLIGMFVNTLVLRADLSGDPTFLELLSRVRRTVMEAFAHQLLPFEMLVEDLQQQEDLSHAPLVQVMLILRDAEHAARHSAGLTLHPVERVSDTTEYDLTLNLVDTAQGLVGWIEYNTDLFDAATITRMCGHHQTLLAGIVANPARRLADLPLLTQAEHRLLAGWNDTQADYPHELCIHELFEVQVQRTPDAVAVVWGDERLFYHELNNRANQVAHRLQALGVKPGDRIALYIERSPELVVGLLGILKAGAVFIPLDSTYPRERLTYVLQDAGAPVLLTQARLAERLPAQAQKVIYLDADDAVTAHFPTDNPVRGITPDALAYVVYTSGSTGRPKGAGVYHRGFVNLLHWYITECGFRAADRVLLITSHGFDLTLKNIFAPLIVGGRLYLPGWEAFDADEIVRSIANDGITFINCTPSAAYLVIDAAERTALDSLASMRCLILGGEPINLTRLQAWMETPTFSTALMNTYGPSECSDMCAFHRLEYPVRDFTAPVPIGRPIFNTELGVVDKALHPVPIGVVGELCISGVGVGAGYLTDAALTAAKFVPHPFSNEPSRRLYKTGDLARYRSDGVLEFVGRADSQVKIRGCRVEIGEIEAVLAQHPDLCEAVVEVREGSVAERRLVAYVVPAREPAPTISELRRFLKAKLSAYMVPAAFVVLNALPLTPHGKVDRRALPAPEAARRIQEDTYVASQNPLQHQLAQVWEELLSVSPIGITDDFFELGGDSILAVCLLDRIEQMYGQRIALPTLLADPTVAHLESALKQQQDAASPLQLWEVQAGASRPPLFFVHGDYILGGFYCFELAQYLDPEQPLYALPQHGPDGRPVPMTIEEMAADHVATLRAFQPQGPYLLGGMCTGGLIVFEMARQLDEQGQKIDLLVIIDMAPDDERLHEPLSEAMQADVTELTYVQALANYVPRSYSQRVTFLWPREEPLFRPDDPSVGWSRVAREVSIHVIPGTHANCMDQYIQEAAACVQSCLNSVPTSG